MCDETGSILLTSAQYLIKVLKTAFHDRLVMQTPHGKKARVIMCSLSSADDAICIAYDFTSTLEGAVTKTALLLRNS